MASKVTVNLLAGLVFCTWAVSIAGLASLQNGCNEDPAGVMAGVEKFSSPMLTCGKLYRYWWFVVSFEIVSIIGLVIANLLGAVRSQKASWAGIFSVLLLLYISMADAFLTAQDLPVSNATATSVGRARVITAGSIMTCVANAFIVLALGTESAEVEEEKKAEKSTI